jgi:hypothetical protein
MVPHPAAHGLCLLADGVAHDFAAGGGAQERRANPDANSGCEADYIADRVILVAVEITSLVAEFGDAIAHAIDALLNPVTRLSRHAIGLFEKISCCFQNGFQEFLQNGPPFWQKR